MRAVALASLLVLVSVAGIAHAQKTELVSVPLGIPAKFASVFDSARTVNIPADFNISVFYAGGLSGPRFMALDPDGHVCVADVNNSIVLRLPDEDHDGVADTAIVIATGTDHAHSIAFHNGDLYAASPSHVWRYSQPDDHGVYTSQTLFIDTLPSRAEGTPNHTTRTILFDDRRDKLFISVGAPCNACREQDSERAAILEFDQDGGNRQIFATGLRNAVGLALDSTDQLWATVAERNLQGADLPRELVTTVDQGGFYGWPFAYGDHVWDDFAATPEYQALLPISLADSAKVASMHVAEATLDAHSTPLGIAYRQADTTWPAAYNNTFFIASHGSYPAIDGRLVANGSKLMTMRQVGGSWTVSDFATGFLTDSVHYTRWARPCGVLFDRNGNLYFSSDHAVPHTPPAIYRISYKPSGAVHPGSPAGQVTLSLAGAGVQIGSPASRIVSVILRDLIGREILTLPVPLAFAARLSLTRIPAGLYFVQVQTEREQITKPLVWGGE